MICEKCGEKNLEGSSRCKKCGSLLKKDELEQTESNKENNSISTDTRIKLCKCGTLIQDDWDVCPNCGSKLEAKTDAKKKKK